MLQSIPRVGNVIYAHPDINSSFKQSLVRELTVVRVGRKYLFLHENAQKSNDEYRYNIDNKIIEEYWGRGDWTHFSACISTDMLDLEIEVNRIYLKRRPTRGMTTEEINALPKYILDILAEYF